jgi:hypothetical protein
MASRTVDEETHASPPEGPSPRVPPLPFGPVLLSWEDAGPTSQAELEGMAMTLGQACPPGSRGAQCAFKDSMTHGILQFALLIAFRCVLHRCRNQEIHC